MTSFFLSLFLFSSLSLLISSIPYCVQDALDLTSFSILPVTSLLLLLLHPCRQRLILVRRIPSSSVLDISRTFIQFSSCWVTVTSTSPHHHTTVTSPSVSDRLPPVTMCRRVGWLIFFPSIMQRRFLNDPLLQFSVRDRPGSLSWRSSSDFSSWESVTAIFSLVIHPDPCRRQSCHALVAILSVGRQQKSDVENDDPKSSSSSRPRDLWSNHNLTYAIFSRWCPQWYPGSWWYDTLLHYNTLDIKIPDLQTPSFQTIIPIDTTITITSTIGKQTFCSIWTCLEIAFLILPIRCESADDPSLKVFTRVRSDDSTFIHFCRDLLVSVRLIVCRTLEYIILSIWRHKRLTILQLY